MGEEVDDGMLTVKKKQEYLSRPRIPNADIELLWDVAYYDLPLEGVAVWRGRKYWFATIPEEIPEQKEFFLLQLPDSEMKKAEDIQRLRELLHDAGNRHDIGYSCGWKWAELTGEDWEAAYRESQISYQRYRAEADQLPQPDLSLGEVIGWSFWKEPETR